MKKFVRVPDDYDIIFNEVGSDRYVSTTYRDALERATNSIDRYTFYIEMEVFRLKVFPVTQLYTKTAIEFVVDDSN